MTDHTADQETPLPQLPAAFSGNNGSAETEIGTEIYPQLSNTRSVLLVAVLSSAGLLTVCPFCLFVTHTHWQKKRMYSR